MNKKNKRNILCHCGSGRKYKICHGKDQTQPLKPWIIILIIILTLSGYFLFKSEQVVNNKSDNYPSLISKEKNNPPLSTGPAPTGKVWSEEHNHWHDAPGSLTPSNSNKIEESTILSRPPDSPPDGKVWSPEHNHWHDKDK